MNSDAPTGERKVYELVEDGGLAGGESVGLFATWKSAQDFYAAEHPDIRWKAIRCTLRDGAVYKRGKSPYGFVKIVIREVRP